ncbi:SWIM zinc finger family protein [Halobaculum sp. P14]|uniref:SWIM zinc finger family protein n=1 Tax=Halobaculum sp. P14 TaxID=3421638 RepID=UPI003EB9E891
MTHSESTAASTARQTLPGGDHTGRAGRARTEPMTVRALRGDAYLVDTDSGRYDVDFDAGRCSCPDHVVRGARCKHLRRVALEIEAGAVAPPGQRRGACAVCGDDVFVPVAADSDADSHLCDRHRPRRGDVVRDRETGSLLVVTDVTTDRADARETAEGRLVADYDTNRDYGRHEPVVDAVYLESVDGTDDTDDAGGDAPDYVSVAGRRRYGFPASRLRRLREDDAPSVAVVGV